MPVTVHIPSPLRLLTGGQAELQLPASSLAELIDLLERDHPGIKKRLCEDSGELRPFITIFVNEKDVRFSSGLNTSLRDGDDVVIVAAIAGG